MGGALRKKKAVGRRENPMGKRVVRAEGSQAAKAPPGRMPTAAMTRRHRQCLRLMGKVLQDAMATLPESPADDDRVGRSAYFCMINGVLEVMQGALSRMPLRRIAQVSRIIAEQRRAEVNSRKVDLALRVAGLSAAAKSAKQRGEVRPLPAYFDQMIRELYGVTLEDGPKATAAVGDGIEEKRSEAGA